MKIIRWKDKRQLSDDYDIRECKAGEHPNWIHVSDEETGVHVHIFQYEYHNYGCKLDSKMIKFIKGLQLEISSNE